MQKTRGSQTLVQTADSDCRGKKWFPFPSSLQPLPGFFLRLSLLIGSEGKASACNAGDPSLIPRSGRSLGGGNGNPL